VKQHHGWIHLISKRDHGTTFEIFFPAAHGTAEPRIVPNYLMPRGSETILVVEDQSEVRALVLAVLKPLGYRCLEARSGHHALEIWSKNRDKVDLVLTDVVMPDGMSGRSLAEKLQVEKPGLKIVFTSGYPRDVLGSDFTLNDSVHFLQKPYPPQKLAQTLRECLDGTALPRAEKI
jgi:two-component system, cell cycle sensor histidine kinase and response regulator CckA